MNAYDEIKVSVIIPVYNAEKYLDNSLGQIINQSLKEIEIICVDDGSTDGSLEMLNQFASRDSRIRVIPQENTNAGAARNRGLAVARGEYLSFLDADDMFELNMLERAYCNAQKNGAEIVIYRSDSYNELTGVYEAARWTVHEELLPNKDVFSNQEVKDLFNAFAGWAWDKLYKREFVLENGLRFQEQKWINDRFFVTCALAKARRIAFLNELLVHKRINNVGALTADFFTAGKWEYWINALLRIKEQLCDWRLYQENKKNYISFSAFYVIWLLDKAIGDAKFEAFYTIVKEQYLLALGLYDSNPCDYYDTQNYYEIMQITDSGALEYKWRRRLSRMDDSYLFPFEMIPQNSQIILYGAGKVGVEFYRQIIHTNYCKVLLWVDKEAETKGNEVSGISELGQGKICECDYVVIAIDDYSVANKIKKDILALKIPEEKIIWRKPMIGGWKRITERKNDS